MLDQPRSIPLHEIGIASLAPELIRDNYIFNLESSYEDYLTEFVNCSNLFLSLSNGEQYWHISKKAQSNSECDCVSGRYQLDFKILGTESSMYASRNLSMQKMLVRDGVLLTMPPKQVDGMYSARTDPLLKGYSYEDLERLEHSSETKLDRNNLNPDHEIQGIIKAVKCDKNTLFFHKDFFFIEKDYSVDMVVATVEEYLCECLSTLLRFRENRVPDRDTFLGAIIQQVFCVGKCENGFIHFYDCIPLVRSNEFKKLYDLTDMRFKHYLKLGELR
jgi:hypothetical protein